MDTRADEIQEIESVENSFEELVEDESAEDPMGVMLAYAGGAGTGGACW